MPYQQQTRDSFYKGRQAYNPSIQAYKEAKEQDVEDAKFMKDMEATGKDYRTALIAWDKNAKALDDEAVQFWKQVSPTMTKLVGETMPQALLMKEKADIDAVRVKWRDSPPEDRAKISEQIATYAENKSKLEGKRGSIADKARSLNLKEYATYIDSLNRTQVTWIHLKLLREKLPDFERNLQEQLANEIKEGNLKPNDFVGQRAFIEKAKTDMFPTVNVDGLRNDILNAQIYKDVDSLGEKWMVRQRQQIAIAESEARVLNLKEDLFNGLSQFKFDADPNDPEADLGTLQSVVNTLMDTLRYENMIQTPTNPDKAARTDLFNMLAEYEASFKTPDGRVKAQDHIRRLLSGNKGSTNKLLVPHRGENGKLKSLSELGKNLTFGDYFNSTQRSEKGLLPSGSSDSAKTLLDEVTPAVVAKKANAFGWPQELKRWDANPPDANYRQQYAAKAKIALDNRLIEHQTYLEILNWEPPGVGPSESKSIIKIHLATQEGDGPLFVKKGEAWLKGLDPEVLSEAMANDEIRIVDYVISDKEVDAHLKDIYPLIDTSNYKSEYLLQKLREDVKREIHKGMYPGTDATGEKSAPPNKQEISAIIKDIIKAKDKEISEGKDNQISDFYLKDGVYVNAMKWQDDWFSRWSKDDIAERESLKRQLALRNVANDKSSEPAWTRTPLFTAKDLIDANQIQMTPYREEEHPTAPVNYLDNDFIDTALELGVSPWQLYNAQRKLLSAEDQERVPAVVEPKGVTAMNLSNAELKTLGMLLKDNNRILTNSRQRNYFQLNKAAARILDTKLINLTKGDENARFRPNQRQLLKVLNRTTDGTTRPTTYDKDGRIGQYAMDKEIVNRLLAARGKNLEDFKSSTLQQEIAEAYISELTNELYGDGRTPTRNIFGTKVPTFDQGYTVNPKNKYFHTILKSPGPLVRQVVSKWKGEEYDSNNPTNLRELSRYNTLIRGGSL